MTRNRRTAPAAGADKGGHPINPWTLTMFFFIAGISPKTKIIENYPQRCTVCGLQQAYQKRIDHYLNIFFIPVMRVKKGEPFTICERCHRTENEFKRDQSPYQEETGLLCKFCGNPIHRGFFYCPYCGKKL